MTISRRFLIASLGVVLPVVTAAAGANAASTTLHPAHHAKRHVHTASTHVMHHHKATHHASASLRQQPQA